MKETLIRDFNKLIENPVSYEAFLKTYEGRAIPTSRSIYGMICLLHFHRKELEKLRKKVGEGNK